MLVTDVSATQAARADARRPGARAVGTVDGATPVDAADAAARHRGRHDQGLISTRTGVRFEPLLPFEAWQELGAKLALYSNATAWWLADWTVFGRERYGRRYRQAIDATGLDYQTLRNYAVVSRRFKLCRRRDDLTFAHHAEVCALSDEQQNVWLDRAAAHRWSRNELRRQLRAALPEPSRRIDVVRLAVEEVRAARWREAARRSDANLTRWIVDVLDHAADSACAQPKTPTRR